MNDEKRVALTADEVAALRHAYDHGLDLPDWVTAQDGKYYRPEALTPEQFDSFADRLNLYNQYCSTHSLNIIKGWVVAWGILGIITIIVKILF